MFISPGDILLQPYWKFLPLDVTEHFYREVGLVHQLSRIPPCQYQWPPLFLPSFDMLSSYEFLFIRTVIAKMCNFSRYLRCLVVTLLT
jgi:hypothetical protein